MKMDQTKTDDAAPAVRSPRIYRGGEVIVEILGVIELKDGRRFKGAVITFPGAPPDLPISVVWDKTPCLLTLESQSDRANEPTQKDSA